jgi:hypothetical protein
MRGMTKTGQFGVLAALTLCVVLPGVASIYTVGLANVSGRGSSFERSDVSSGATPEDPEQMTVSDATGLTEGDPGQLLVDNRSHGSESTGEEPESSVPEPATLALVGLGLIGIGMLARKKRVSA